MARYITYNDDCLKYLKEINNNSVDLILTDPPYNLSQYSTGNISFVDKKKNQQLRATLNNDIANWDKDFDPSDLKDDFLRVLKPTGNIFAFTSPNLFGRWHEIYDPIFDSFNFFIWHKTNPAPKIFKAGFLNSCEMVICLWNRGHKWNFGKQDKMHNFFESSICMGKERIKNPKHPTQKPVGILKHLINLSTDKNDIILDPYMGTGSTGVAAIQLKRKFIGIEMDENFFEIANERLKVTQPEIKETTWSSYEE